MTNLDKTYTAAELQQMIRKMRQMIDELVKISKSNRLNSYEGRIEGEKLIWKIMEMNGILHKAWPANM
jgi:hypothetical protein